MRKESCSSRRDKRPGRRLSYMRLAAIMLGLIACGTARAQFVVQTNGGSTVSQGTTLSIDSSPAMPLLTFSVSGGALTCDSLNWSMDISWTFVTGNQGSLLERSGTFYCNQTQTVDWNSEYGGGSATVSWSDDCGHAGNISFTILGTNPSPAAVDSFIPSTPWFWRNLLAWESRAWSTSPTGIYHQFASGGTPLDCDCPNGIGLTQLDPANGGTYPSGINDFWAWNYNEVDGFNLLANIRTAAYNNWTSEWNDMSANTGGNLVPANWPSDCTTHANGAVCGGFTAGTTLFCSFSSANANGSPNGFGDGSWIHRYNGSFFVDWVDGTPNSPGYWEYDAQGPTNGYVFNVCKSPAI